MASSGFIVESYPMGEGGMQTGQIPSGVRITHKLTGHIEECETERSQHLNKAKAMAQMEVYLASIDK